MMETNLHDKIGYLACAMEPLYNECVELHSESHKTCRRLAKQGRKYKNKYSKQTSGLLDKLVGGRTIKNAKCYKNCDFKDFDEKVQCIKKNAGRLGNNPLPSFFKGKSFSKNPPLVLK